MESSNFFTESDAAGAVDASVHVGDYQWADIFVLHCPFELVISTMFVSIEVRVVLEVTFATLIADGAVQRVVGQQKLHHSSSGVTSVF